MSRTDHFNLSKRAPGTDPSSADVEPTRAPAWSQVWRGAIAYSGALGVAAVVEGLLTTGAPFVLYTGFGLALLPGALLGTVLGATLAWLERGARLRQLMFLVAALAAGVGLCAYLGLFRALSGGA